MVGIKIFKVLNSEKQTQITVFLKIITVKTKEEKLFIH